MKLYKLPNAPAGERWHSSKTGLKDFTEIELPKDGRAGMAQLFNANEAEIVFEAFAPLAGPIEGPISTQGRPLDELEQAELRAAEQQRAKTVTRERELTATSIVEFILDDATVAQTETIFAALGTRFKEQANVTR